MNGSTILQKNIQKWAKQKGNDIYFIETETDKIITYQELIYAVAALQKFLEKKSQKVIVALPGGITNSVIWLTTLIFGHHLIPISPDTTEFEYNQLLTKHKPTLLITETDTWVTKPYTKNLTLSDIETIITKGIKNKTSFKTNDKPVDGTVYLETSGSTGAPKGMILSVSQMVITADNIRKGLAITKEDRCLNVLPFYHINAPAVGLTTSLLAGAALINAVKFSRSRFWSWVKKYDPTWVSVVPTIIAILLKDDKPKFLNRSSIRFFRTGSAPLPKTNLTKFEEKFCFPIIEQYGISEAATTIFSNPLPPKKHKPGSAGFPLGVKAKIIDIKTGKIVKQGEVGEVCVKGKQIIDHYEEGRGQDSFKDGWFLTGDLGYFDKEGYLFLTGRKKEIIIRGGENIAPREIEEILFTYPGVVEVAVVGQPDQILGEKVVAFLVTENPNKKDLADNIKNFAKSKLIPQKVPAEIYILDALPRKKINKIDKSTLKNLFPPNNNI